MEGMDAGTLRHLRLGFLLIAYALFVLNGARLEMDVDPGLSDIAIGILIAIAITKACAMDARLLGKSLPRTAFWVMIFLWPVAAPVYLVWSRGWLGLAWILAYFAGAVVAVTAGRFVTLLV